MIDIEIQILWWRFRYRSKPSRKIAVARVRAPWWRRALAWMRWRRIGRRAPIIGDDGATRYALDTDQRAKKIIEQLVTPRDRGGA